MNIRIIFVALCALVALPTYSSTSNRDDSLRLASAWQRPAWMDESFAFRPDFDVVKSFPTTGEAADYIKSAVDCQMTEESAQKTSNGQTMKLYCEMGAPGARRVVKFKYKFDDGEIAGEILSTRLLWALGFAADQMFLIPKLKCYGCTADPFRDKRVDPTSLKTPRIFELTAAEVKFPGKGIEVGDAVGWGFEEFMTLLPRDRALRVKARTEREALRLLSVFLRHADNKPDNQRLSCAGKVNAEGGCSGATTLVLHDVGLTFGRGIVTDDYVSKANFEDWNSAEIWADPRRCIGRLGNNAYGDMEEPVIREEGRLFLAKLLRGFSEGAAGRKRVESLFRYARAELRYGSIEEWTDTFLTKVEQIDFPLGRGNPKFRCPN